MSFIDNLRAASTEFYNQLSKLSIALRKKAISTADAQLQYNICTAQFSKALELNNLQDLVPHASTSAYVPLSLTAADQANEKLVFARAGINFQEEVITNVPKVYLVFQSPEHYNKHLAEDFATLRAAYHERGQLPNLGTIESIARENLFIAAPEEQNKAANLALWVN